MLGWPELTDLMGPCPHPGDTLAQEGAGTSEPSATGWEEAELLPWGWRDAFSSSCKVLRLEPDSWVRPQLSLRLTPHLWGIDPQSGQLCIPAAFWSLLFLPHGTRYSQYQPRNLLISKTSLPGRDAVLPACPSFPVCPCSSPLCAGFTTVKCMEILYLCKFTFEIVLT